MTSMSLHQPLADGRWFAARSERGLRHWNTDYVTITEGPCIGTAIAISDGDADEAGAALRARMAAEITAFTTAQTGMACAGVAAARSALSAYDQVIPPKTTTAAAILTAFFTTHAIRLAWVGNLMAFGLTSDGILHTLTEHSHPVKSGPREVTTDLIHQRRIRLRCPEAYGPADAMEISRLLLCSDGLTEQTSREHIAEILRSAPPLPAAACTELVDLALTAGTRDNVTVAVIDLPPRADELVAQESISAPTGGGATVLAMTRPARDRKCRGPRR
ncbi:hypothetical protein OG339_48060 (plasmid) [Streptosporangium sp. NBC_01495]|uniref:PP2C family protein-serine/threonine phosphatase n=1 Tax=Streptosporangium sp. NBC_01495 TaxID=2903899 RepID=UPI002E2F9A61|nr:hypothetical protein [Streptosporangium sp. NBC_01495]